MKTAAEAIADILTAHPGKRLWFHVEADRNSFQWFIDVEDQAWRHYDLTVPVDVVLNSESSLAGGDSQPQ